MPSKTGLAQNQFTRNTVVFAGGGKILVGDNIAGVSNDDLGNVIANSAQGDFGWVTATPTSAIKNTSTSLV